MTKEAPRTYRIQEVARLLGIGRNQAYSAAKRGDLPVIKIGKRLFVPRAAFDRMLEQAGK
jgi:excisionase family DNA binding protein